MPTYDSPKPIAIFHEHPDWFRPLFAEFDRRGTPYVRLDAGSHAYDPGETEAPYAAVFNRASPSAYLRGRANTTFYNLERIGVPVVNGARAYAMELTKAGQLDLLASLGLGYPRARVVNSGAAALAAADALRYPVLVKANVGGSGAGIVEYASREQLAAAVAADALDFGVDGTALVQERAPLRDGRITRVETLGGRFLYAINVYPAGDFNLCPADACQTTGGAELSRAACALDAPKNGMRVEGYTPPADVIAAVEAIVQGAGIDVGGVEYLVDDRDGAVCYYDVNALSNFVADAPRVVGFDPFARLADYLEARAGLVTADVAGGA